MFLSSVTLGCFQVPTQWIWALRKFPWIFKSKGHCQPSITGLDELQPIAQMQSTAYFCKQSLLETQPSPLVLYCLGLCSHYKDRVE